MLISTVEFWLSQFFPNPFTIINYEIPTSPFLPLLIGEGKRVRSISLKIYDLLGRVVGSLANEAKPAGRFSVEWNASKYPSGIYYYELRTDEFHSIKKMILMK